MTKKRLTITIDPKILNKVDSIIDKKNVLNRSHAIETVLKTHFGSSIDTAIILAGGQKVKKTPLFKLNDINLLQYQLNQLLKTGIKNVILYTNDDTEYYEQWIHEYGMKNMNLIVEREDKPLGTAGALSNLKKFINDKPVLVIHGDVYSDLDMKDFLDYHLEDSESSTIVLTTVGNPQKYGLVKVRGSEVIEFLEKPKSEKSSNLISAGIYIIDPKIFDYIKPGKFVSMEKDVFPIMAKGKELVSYIHTGVWCDITYSEMYREASAHFQKTHK